MMSDWEKDCQHWWGRTLMGYYAYWCFDWDFLPIDETTSEMDCCGCYDLYFDDYKRGWISIDFEPWYWGA